MADGKFICFAKNTCAIALVLTSSWRVALSAFGCENPLNDGQEFIMVGILGAIGSYFLTRNMFQNWEKEIISKN